MRKYEQYKYVSLKEYATSNAECVRLNYVTICSSLLSQVLIDTGLEVLKGISWQLWVRTDNLQDEAVKDGSLMKISMATKSKAKKIPIFGDSILKTVYK